MFLFYVNLPYYRKICFLFVWFFFLWENLLPQDSSLIQDNVPCHTAKIVKQFFKAESIKVMPWQISKSRSQSSWDSLEHDWKNVWARKRNNSDWCMAEIAGGMGRNHTFRMWQINRRPLLVNGQKQLKVMTCICLINLLYQYQVINCVNLHVYLKFHALIFDATCFCFIPKLSSSLVLFMHTYHRVEHVLRIFTAILNTNWNL